MEKTPGMEFYDPFFIVGSLFESMETKICEDCPTAVVLRASDARSRKNPTMYSKEAGCCSRCADNTGYFTNDIRIILGMNYMRDYSMRMRTDVRRKLREMADNKKEKYGFDEDYGFFDKDKHACRLPRQERSITCTVFLCDYMEKILSNPDKDTIIRQEERMAEIRQEEIGLL